MDVVQAENQGLIQGLIQGQIQAQNQAQNPAQNEAQDEDIELPPVEPSFLYRLGS